eukprot:10936826-Alexandrium_andersonii.AAC.1
MVRARGPMLTDMEPAAVRFAEFVAESTEAAMDGGYEDEDGSVIPACVVCGHARAPSDQALVPQ